MDYSARVSAFSAQAPAFPSVDWGEKRVTFLPASVPLPAEATLEVALVFALFEGRFVVADILGRGWCIPGGHLEPGETPEQAARREAREETGVLLNSMSLLGHFLFHSDSGATQIVPTFTAQVTRFEALPASGESRGIKLLTLAELPHHYYLWDALIEAVFAYALQCSP